MIVRAPLLIRLQRLREPRAPTHEVRAANRRVVERVDDLVARRFGVSPDGGALALVVAILSAPTFVRLEILR
jgi:hypothetical protein